MSERNEKRILNAVFAVLAIIIIIFAIDIEVKLSVLMNSEPLIVNTYPETSDSAMVDIYSFHNELTADNSTTAHILSTTAQAEINTSESEAVISSNVTEPYTQVTTTEATTQYIRPSYTTTMSINEQPTAVVPSTIWSVDADQNFYRTKSGTKYHKADCPYLKNSRILVSVEEIISEGYEPCSKCMKGE